MKVKIYCKLSDAKAGLLLAEDVCDQQGNCLLASDSILTEKKLSSIQTRHIDGFLIWQEQTLSKSEIIEQREAITARLAHRFRQMQDNPEMIRLHALLLTYRTECYEQKETPVSRVDNAGDTQ